MKYLLAVFFVILSINFSFAQTYQNLDESHARADRMAQLIALMEQQNLDAGGGYQISLQDFLYNQEKQEYQPESLWFQDTKTNNWVLKMTNYTEICKTQWSSSSYGGIAHALIAHSTSNGRFVLIKSKRLQKKTFIDKYLIFDKMTGRSYSCPDVLALDSVGNWQDEQNIIFTERANSISTYNIANRTKTKQLDLPPISDYTPDGDWGYYDLWKNYEDGYAMPVARNGTGFFTFIPCDLINKQILTEFTLHELGAQDFCQTTATFKGFHDMEFLGDRFAWMPRSYRVEVGNCYANWFMSDLTSDINGPPYYNDGFTYAFNSPNEPIGNPDNLYMSHLDIQKDNRIVYNDSQHGPTIDDYWGWFSVWDLNTNDFYVNSKGEIVRWHNSVGATVGHTFILDDWICKSGNWKINDNRFLDSIVSLANTEDLDSITTISYVYSRLKTPETSDDGYHAQTRPFLDLNDSHLPYKGWVYWHSSMLGARNDNDVDIYASPFNWEMPLVSEIDRNGDFWVSNVTKQQTEITTGWFGNKISWEEFQDNQVEWYHIYVDYGNEPELTQKNRIATIHRSWGNEYFDWLPNQSLEAFYKVEPVDMFFRKFNFSLTSSKTVTVSETRLSDKPSKINLKKSEI